MSLTEMLLLSVFAGTLGLALMLAVALYMVLK